MTMIGPVRRMTCGGCGKSWPIAVLWPLGKCRVCGVKDWRKA